MAHGLSRGARSAPLARVIRVISADGSPNFGQMDAGRGQWHRHADRNGQPTDGGLGERSRFVHERGGLLDTTVSASTSSPLTE